jgi:hypothetical protein
LDGTPPPVGWHALKAPTKFEALVFIAETKTGFLTAFAHLPSHSNGGHSYDFSDNRRLYQIDEQNNCNA